MWDSLHSSKSWFAFWCPIYIRLQDPTFCGHWRLKLRGFFCCLPIVGNVCNGYTWWCCFWPAQLLRGPLTPPAVFFPQSKGLHLCKLKVKDRCSTLFAGNLGCSPAQLRTYLTETWPPWRPSSMSMVLSVSTEQFCHCQPIAKVLVAFDNKQTEFNLIVSCTWHTYCISNKSAS